MTSRGMYARCCTSLSSRSTWNLGSEVRARDSGMLFGLQLSTVHRACGSFRGHILALRSTGSIKAVIVGGHAPHNTRIKCPFWIGLRVL
jgi:hypothetical protein